MRKKAAKNARGQSTKKVKDLPLGPVEARTVKGGGDESAAAVTGKILKAYNPSAYESTSTPDPRSRT